MSMILKRIRFDWLEEYISADRIVCDRANGDNLNDDFAHAGVGS